MIPITNDEYTAAMKKMEADIKAGKPGSPPNPYTEKAVKIDDIKISMSINVTAEEDIAKSAVINASKVTFMAITAQPGTPGSPMPSPAPAR
jgi:hypothetical protein